MTKDEMVGWHHRVNGDELERQEINVEMSPGDGERWGSLACCSPWGGKEANMT